MPNGKHRQSVQRNLIVNTTEIAKMANVSVSTVSNWKRRSDGIKHLMNAFKPISRIAASTAVVA